MSELIPDALTSNPYRGGTQAYLATEHYKEGWNDCRDQMLERQEIAQREQLVGRAAELAKHLREQAKIFRDEDPLARGAKELEDAANLLECRPSHADLAACATKACLCRTSADGWTFKNTAQLQNFLDMLK